MRKIGTNSKRQVMIAFPEFDQPMRLDFLSRGFYSTNSANLLCLLSTCRMSPIKNSRIETLWHLTTVRSEKILGDYQIGLANSQLFPEQVDWREVEKMQILDFIGSDYGPNDLLLCLHQKINRFSPISSRRLKKNTSLKELCH